MRELTAIEKVHIRDEKKKVNIHLQKLKTDLTKQIKKEKEGQRGYVTKRAQQLIDSREAIQLVKGTPCHFVVESQMLLVNYDLVNKALKLTKGMLRYVEIRNNTSLIIKYEGGGSKGEFEFRLLPDQYNLLDQLPVIYLEGAYYH